MKCRKPFTTSGLVWFTILTSFVFALGPLGRAQDNAVYATVTNTGPSAAFLDASTFTAPNTATDICAKINDALIYASTNFPMGVVIDARGILSPPASLACPAGTTPWAYQGRNPTNPSTILLPAATVVILKGWVLPSNTRIVGTEPTPAPSSVGIPTLQADAHNFDTNTAMIEMGSSSLCSSPCTGISVEHLTLDANTAAADGIHNGWAQGLSYAAHVILRNISTAGLRVDGSATDSGPYTDINFVAGGGTPACVRLETQTRGVHGITCIGNTNTVAPGPAGNLAGIYVDASNNSVEDVHIEEFYDGIEIGNGGSNSVIGNVVVSNLTVGLNNQTPVTNAVHICGSDTDVNDFGYCSNHGSVSDVAILQATDRTPGGQVTSTIRDDVSGVSITPPNRNSESTVAMYVLGEAVGSTIQPPTAYSRFSTSLSYAYTVNGVNGTGSTVVPSWAIGNGSPIGNCNTPGALFSNTAGSQTANTTVFVCTGGQWQPII